MPTAHLHKAVLVERSNLWMDRFHDNLGVVKTASIKVEHLYCELTSRFFKGKPRRLRLSWTVGGNVTIA
jgi:hypothetical protein